MIIDTPRASQNTFIFYSAATGKTAQALADGVEPGHIRQTCTVTSLTPMTVSGDGFRKAGLRITPVLSDDRLQCSFDIRITECDFYVSDSFSLGFATSGDNDRGIDPNETTVRFKVICYGCDRPYLANNFVEYNCAKDPLVSRRHVAPVSVNGLAGVHIHELNIENSGIEVRDNDADGGENVVYYNWSPGKTGAYGIAVEGVTYEGGHGIATAVSYPFPQGKAADVLVIANYPDYFAAGYLCLLVPAGKINLPEFSIHGGPLERYGGAFFAVLDDEGKLSYFEHKHEEYPAQNTVYHVDHKITLTGEVWKLEEKRYLDNAAADWVVIASAPAQTLSIPAVDDGKQVTLQGSFSLPPFTGWSADFQVSGDARYYADGRFFNTVNISSPDDSFADFPVYCGAGGVMYRTQKQSYEVTENGEKRDAELILFPDAAGWEINSGGKLFPDTVVSEMTQTVIPYAPPRSGDVTFHTGPTVPVLTSSGASASAAVPMAMNNDLGGIMLNLGECAAGIWNRYPYHRLLDPADEYVATGAVAEGANAYNVTLDETRCMSSGTMRGEYWEYIYPHTGSRTVDRGSSYRYLTHGGDGRNFTAEIDIPLDGRVQGAQIKSLCGMVVNPEFTERYDVVTTGEIEHTWDGENHTDYEWINADTSRTVTLPNGDSARVPATSNYQIKEPAEYIDSDPGDRLITSTYTETEPSGSKRKSEGALDCYMHFGQSDSDEGRKITCAVSVAGPVAASSTIPFCHEYKVEENGEITEHTEERGEREISLGTQVSYAGAFPELCPLDEPGGEFKRDRKSEGSYKISIKSDMTTAISGGTWEESFENTKIGEASYGVYWYYENQDPNDGQTSYFPYDCYAVTGESKRCHEQRMRRITGSATITYDSGNETAALSYSRSSETYHSANTFFYKQTGEVIDSQIRTSTEKWRKSEVEQTYSGYEEVNISPVADGKYKVKRTVYPGGEFLFLHDTRDESRRKDLLCMIDHEGNRFYRDEETGEIPEVPVFRSEEIKALAVKDIRKIFDDFRFSLPQKDAEFDPVPEDWQYVYDGVEYTDSPLSANMIMESTFSYTESSTERSQPEIKVTVKRVDDEA